MKKIIIFLVLLAVIVIGYAAAGPFITIHKIKAGVIQQDAEELSENIDFPSLRSNLKEQLNAFVMKNAASELQNNPFAVLAMGFASKIVDGMVDSFVTPSGIRNLMEGKKPTQAQSVAKVSQESEGDRFEPFKNARYTFDGISKFSVWVKGDKEKEIRFVLLRDGLSWKLSNIVIPMIENPNQSFEDHNYDATAKMDIKNAYTASQALFSDKPNAIVTKESLTNYGFKPSGGVTISILDGTFGNLGITSRHAYGKITYSIDAQGEIVEHQ